LDNESEVFPAIKDYPVRRSFPSAENLTVEAVDALKKVLQYGNIPYQLGDPGTRLCFKQGWVHAVTTDLDTEETVLVLPSKLHEK
jgi:hypothetical protein